MEKQNIKIKRKILTFLLLLLFCYIIIKLVPLFMQITTEERKKCI